MSQKSPHLLIKRNFSNSQPKAATTASGYQERVLNLSSFWLADTITLMMHLQRSMIQIHSLIQKPSTPTRLATTLNQSNKMVLQPVTSSPSPGCPNSLLPAPAHQQRQEASVHQRCQNSKMQDSKMGTTPKLPAPNSLYQHLLILEIPVKNHLKQFYRYKIHTFILTESEIAQNCASHHPTT